jgi:hypothetical protein
MTRQELIEKIIDRHLEEIHQGGGAEGYLREVFMYGNTYRGYNAMHKDELLSIWNGDCEYVEDIVEALEEEAA